MQIRAQEKDKGRRSERRSEHRLTFEGVIPGHIRHESQELRFRTFDISKKGMGLYLSPCPKEGEEILLELNEGDTRPLRFTIKHIYGESQGMKRCGIELLPSESAETDLIEILTRYSAE